MTDVRTESIAISSKLFEKSVGINMFRQFQMIRPSEIPKIVYHYLMSCLILLKKHNIITINIGKQED